MDKNKNLILPGNPRYQPEQMKDIFGYDNLYRKLAEVEIATLETLGEMKIIPANDFKKLTNKAKEDLRAITTSEVDIIEKEITHHDVRAWVRKAQEILDKDLARWVHIPLTSYDAIDTARILQFREAYEKVLRPSLKEVVNKLCKLTEKNSKIIQIGRTHGQHALPITVGFWLATVLSRIVDNWEKLDNFSNKLTGKISGAVGAHNAQFGLKFSTDYNSFEKKVLEKLNLKPARISTQIIPPEYLGYFFFSCVGLSATLGQFGRDARNLMRSEIAEIAESFEKGQVGSSTMAHKRNPINFENLEGMWIRTKNEFGKVLDNLISDHQRDLVGSSVARDYPVILINLQQQLNTLLRKNKAGITFLERLVINQDACRMNFEKNSDVILAEPLYIALQMAGFKGDAHEFVNHELVPRAKAQGSSLVEILLEISKKDKKVEEVISRMGNDMLDLLESPNNYTGDASKQAREISKYAKRVTNKLI